MLIDNSLKDQSPIFVLCFPRSGSTLLRYCLDSHPQISCPPETSMAATYIGIQESSLAVSVVDEFGEVAYADSLCRLFADLTLGRLAQSQGKERWCDKSLSTINHTDLIERIYPKAQYLCLFRECTDTVMSGLDASPWGFNGYGYLEYVRSNAENLVFSLTRMWFERTSQLCSFIDSHPKNAFALRYEDLVVNPQKTLESVFEFLGYEWSPDLIEESQIFGADHGRGRGDHKIDSAESFYNTIGKTGWRMPRSLIPEMLRSEVDGLSARLGYPALNNVFDRPFAGHPVTRENSDVGRELFEALERTVGAVTFKEWHAGLGALIIRDQHLAIEVDVIGRSVRILDAPESDFTRFDFRIVTDTNSIRDYLSGALSIGSAMRHGHFNLAPFSEASTSTNQEQIFAEVTDFLKATRSFSLS